MAQWPKICGRTQLVFVAFYTRRGVIDPQQFAAWSRSAASSSAACARGAASTTCTHAATSRTHAAKTRQLMLSPTILGPPQRSTRTSDFETLTIANGCVGLSIVNSATSLADVHRVLTGP